jgi:ribonuclease VapC
MVIDTSALLAVIFDESEAETFAELLATSETTLLSAVSWLEAGIVVEAKKGKDAARDYQSFLAAARVKIVEFTPDHGRIALEAWRDYGKGNHKAGLNLGDCCAYALSKVSGRPLLFKGRDFSQTDVAAVRY